MRTVAVMLVALALPRNAVAADAASWQSLAGLQPGRKIEVATKDDLIKGDFVRFNDQGITVSGKKGERSLSQAEVTHVRIAKRSRGVWIGAAAGGGGGAIVGAALGSRVANESGGDFNNLKGAITVACAAIGALIGAAVGSAVRRGETVYRKP